MRKSALRIVSYLLLFALISVLGGCSLKENTTKAVVNEIKKSDIMLKDISEDLESFQYYKAEEKDITDKYGEKLLTPKYLPERFKSYGVYLSDSVKELPVVKQIWYDPDKLEVFTVTQSKKNSDPDREDEIHFTDMREDGKKISDECTWAKYVTTYGFTRGGTFGYGHMFVNDENNRDEYNKILKSLTQ